VHCGDGRQTIKWLALSAARRFAACTPAGRVRCREAFHSGRRPIPDAAGGGADAAADGTKAAGSTTSPDDARGFPRYSQFGVRDGTTGQILRRVDGVGGLYRQGMLLPVRVSSPTRKTRAARDAAGSTSPPSASASVADRALSSDATTTATTSSSAAAAAAAAAAAPQHHHQQPHIPFPPASIFYSHGDPLSPAAASAAAEESFSAAAAEESFWDALQVTYGYSRMEHPHDQRLRIERERDEILAQRSDLKRQQLMLNFGNADDPPWRRAQAAARAEVPRPSTVYELREMRGRHHHANSGSAKAARRDWRQPRRSLFARLAPMEEKRLRPTTTIAVTRPRFGAQTASTPLRHWGGPRIAVPDSFTTPSDLFDPAQAALDPSASIASCFRNGDHVWVDLDMRGGEASASAFSLSAFHRQRYFEKESARAPTRTPSARSEVEVRAAAVAKTFLVRRRNMSDENMADGGKERRVLGKLLRENIGKSKMSRLVRLGRGRRQAKNSSGAGGGDGGDGGGGEAAAAAAAEAAELERVERVILQCYLILENTFRHFSFLAPGDNFSLSANEWSSMCSACGILTSPPQIDAAAASRVFIASNVNLSARSGTKTQDKPEPFDEDNPKNALIMYEFLEALLRLALEKHGPGTPHAGTSPSEKLQRLLEENVLPVGREITKSWERTLEEVESDDVQEALQRDLDGLKFAFVFYAHKKPKKIKSRAGREDPHLTMEEWIHALEEARVLEAQTAKGQSGGSSGGGGFGGAGVGSPRKGKRQRSPSTASDGGASTAAVLGAGGDDAEASSGGGLTHQRAQECFVAANSHSARLQRKHTAAAEERSFRQMEFPEFLEALVHVAARADARSSLAQNLDMIALGLRKAIQRQSQDTAHQRAMSLMERIDFKLEDLQG
jgi:hypothetical protein